MAAHQAPLSLGFSRQEHWSGLPFPSPMHESEKWKWSRSVVSDPQRPHGLQPTRLLRPWDFPGKSTGVGCHCLLCLAPRNYLKKKGETGGQPKAKNGEDKLRKEKTGWRDIRASPLKWNNRAQHTWRERSLFQRILTKWLMKGPKRKCKRNSTGPR